MKIHPILLKHTVTALQEIFNTDTHAGVVIKNTLKSDKRLGARDRKFIAETVYDIVRWWRLLWKILMMKQDNDPYKILLVIGAYLIIFKDEFPENEEFSKLNKEKTLASWEKLKTIRKFRESIPDWLDEYGEEQLPGRWEKELASLNLQALPVIRVNTLKTSLAEVRKKLLENGISHTDIPETPTAIVIQTRKNLFDLEMFHNGFFEMQDANSQRVASAMDLEPGMRVVDACAGAGGKSLHIAALMNNKGRLISLDVEQWKLDELRKRARRNGVSIIETKLIESSKTIKKLAESADRVLLDVPCSGIGVLKRNPDSKWKLSVEAIEKLKIEQQNILMSYSRMVKPGGLLIYSTCSIFPTENQMQIEKFISGNSEKFRLIEQNTYYPSETGFDGFFIAKMQRI